MTTWLPAGTSTNAWSLLDRAHSGFWDDSPIIDISVTPVQTPVTTNAFARFDANMFASGFGATATATVQASFYVMDGTLAVSSTPTASATILLNSVFDGALAQAITFANPVFFNAALEASAVTRSAIASLDGLLYRSAVSATTSLDGFLASAAVTLKFTSLDAFISSSAVTTPKTFGLDAELKRNLSAVASLDVALFKTDSKSINLDATALKTIQSTKTSSYDTLLVKTITQDVFALDSVFLKTLTLTNQVGIDALLFRNIHPYALFDSFLNLTFANTGADAVLVSGTSIGTTTRTVGMDASMQVFPVTGSVDAVIAGGNAGFFFFY